MNAPFGGALDSSPSHPPEVYAARKKTNKDGRHVGLDFYDLLIEALIDNEVRFVSWVLSSCQFQWWNRTSTGDRVINVSPRSSSNASWLPFSQHSSGTSVRALFSRQVVDVIRFETKSRSQAN